MSSDSLSKARCLLCSGETITCIVDVLLQLATASSGKSMGPLVAGLSTRGKLIVVGASDERLEANLTHLLICSKTITGEIVGTAIDEDDTLDFSVLQGIRPMVETVPLEEAQAGYDTLMRNEARFRIVLTNELVAECNVMPMMP
jgi:D-arabinose 1-dehydrogenase-like Zn-dependent alcohol dehydrogenase